MMYDRLPPRLPAPSFARGLHCSLLCVLTAVSSVSLFGCSQKDPPSEATTDDETVVDDGASDPTDPDVTDTASDGADDAPTEPTDDTDSSDDGVPTQPEDAGSGGGPSTETDPDTDPTETDPSNTDTDEPPDGSEIPADEMAEYFPMLDGATWTYRHTKVGEVAWNEITSMVEGSGADAGSFILTDSADRQNDVTVQWWKQVGTAVMRVKREESRNGALRSRTTYDPGFTRFDTLWSKPEFSQIITYTHVDTTDTGTTTTMREQHFKVLAIDASVTIDDTTYDNCIQMERKRPDTMDVGHYWFAKGIGKVKEIDPDSLTTEELIDYQIP